MAPTRYSKRSRPAVSYPGSMEYDEGSDVGDLNDTDVPHPSEVARDQDSKETSGEDPEDKTNMFMKMAPEIRNTIYKLTLMEHYDMVYLALQPTNAYTSRRKLVRGVRNGRFGNWGFTTRDRATMRRGTGRNIALLRASKAIYAEGVGLVYGQTFGFYHLGALQAFLLPLGDQAFGLLRRMELRIGDAEWDLLPDTSLQLAHMEELKIRSLDGRFHGTGTMFTRYLTATARHLDTWQITLRNFDCLTGIKIARDLYSCAYPLVQQMAEDGGENGIEKLLNMLDLYEDPQIHLQGFHEVKSRFQPYSAHTYPWFDARARTVHDAMAQELFKIIAEDK